MFVVFPSTNQSRSYFTTDGQPECMSWCRAHSPVRRLMSESWCLVSDKRTGLQFAVQSLNGLSRAESVTVLYCLIWDSPRNRVAQLYPWALISLSFNYNVNVLTLLLQCTIDKQYAVVRFLVIAFWTAKSVLHGCWISRCEKC
jgi:hypothetical protein